MVKSQVTFAKIISHPTEATWSQAYTAGKVAALFSLEEKTHDDTATETQQLHLVGKDLLSTFEAEYFTLETKTLASIKEAIQTTCDKVPSTITATIIVSSVVDTILYLFIFGNGTILLKREKTVGVLLDTRAINPDEKSSIQTASGFLQPDDLVILATNEFIESFSEELGKEIKTSSSPADLGEALSPHIRRIKHGNAAAIFFSWQEEQPVSATLPVHKLEPEVEEENEEKPPFLEEKLSEEIPKVPKRTLKLNVPHFRLPSRRFIFLCVGILLVIILIGSIFMAMQQQKKEQEQQTYQTLFVPAQKKYAEAQNLQLLNKKTATDDLQSAQTMLQQAKTIFPMDSQEGKDTVDLLQKISDQLTALSQIKSAPLTEASGTDSPLLTAEIKQTDASYFTQDDKKIYYVTDKAITAIDKSSQKSTDVIKNQNDWTTVGGLGVYFGNMYVLDKKANQIYKYPAAASGFGSKANYFAKDAQPDVSQAAAMTIDGSVWILTTDGHVTKYTKGKQDDFALKGLDKPLSHPTRIYTDVNASNVYILDNGNARVAVFTKDGTFVIDYPADTLARAKDFDVFEKDKKMFVLSDNKIWKIDLK